MPDYLIKLDGIPYRCPFPFAVSPQKLLEALHNAEIAPPKPEKTEAERQTEAEKQTEVQARRISEMFEKAKKIQATDWNEPIWSPAGYGSSDGFFHSIDAYLEYCEDEELEPERFVWASKPEGLPRLDAQLISEQVMEDWDCDEPASELKGLAELDVALTRFFDLNANMIYHDCDYRCAVILSEGVSDA